MPLRWQLCRQEDGLFKLHLHQEGLCGKRASVVGQGPNWFKEGTPDNRETARRTFRTKTLSNQCNKTRRPFSDH
jgi:hypothetical protein